MEEDYKTGFTIGHRYAVVGTTDILLSVRCVSCAFVVASVQKKTTKHESRVVETALLLEVEGGKSQFNGDFRLCQTSAGL